MYFNFQKWIVLKLVFFAKSLQSCPTLCDPIDGSLPGSSVPGILQARTLECVAISFSNAWKWKVKVKSLSHVRLLAIPWTAAYQAPPSMGFSRQEYWSGVPLNYKKCMLCLLSLLVVLWEKLLKKMPFGITALVLLICAFSWSFLSDLGNIWKRIRCGKILNENCQHYLEIYSDQEETYLPLLLSFHSITLNGRANLYHLRML